jgi:hypothetical protein
LKELGLLIWNKFGFVGEPTTINDNARSKVPVDATCEEGAKKANQRVKKVERKPSNM